MTGAMIIIGADVAALPAERPLCASGSEQPPLPVWLTEILGRSILERTIDELQRSGVSDVTIIASDVWRGHAAAISAASATFRWAEDPWSEAIQELAKQREDGAGTVLVINADGYAEIDVADLLQFHREQKRAVTEVMAGESFVGWKIFESPSNSEVRSPSPEVARYWVRGYVNRLRRAQELRRLAVDSLSSRCALRPYGREIRPGVWLSDGAEVDRGARVVPPVFIGRGTKVREQCLITRSSNVESNCTLDYGTVVEDSMILANTYVGIGLDITHSIVNGDTLFNLEHGVTVQLADHGVIRQNRISRKEVVRHATASSGLAGVY